MSNDGPFPKIHPRERPCNNAENDLRTAINEVVTKYELTTAEQIRVVNGAFSGFIGGIAKYAIRHERHGDTEKPGGFA